MNAAALARHALPAAPPVAFHYEAVFSTDAERWYRRFPYLVTGGFLSRDQTQRLRTPNHKLIAYRWSSGFYPDDPVSASLRWQRQVLSKAPQWLLNSSPIGSGSASDGRLAHWYDFGDPGCSAALARHLAELIEAHRYDGFFFDTLGSQSLPAAALREFGKRHRESDYDRAQSEFLRELRRLLGSSAILFLNQGFRNPDVFLPFADLDLSESYFTALAPGGGTMVRKLWNTVSPWESVYTPMQELVLSAKRKHPNVQFVHLNYAAGSHIAIRRAIQFSYACAKLWNHTAYLVAPSCNWLEADEIYFTDLGAPLTAEPELLPETGIAWRVFEKAIVAVNTGPRDTRIPGLDINLIDPPAGYVFRR